MRKSGILMHLTSLPGPYGIGTMGKEAFKFVDFLAKAGQGYWQILPLNPTGYGDSPYQSCSTFAGNPFLIDLSTLIEDGLLTKKEVEAVTWFDSEDRVNYGIQYNEKWKLLRKAFERFTDEDALDDFCYEQTEWLSDFAMYMALKEEYSGKPWHQWPGELKNRRKDAIDGARWNLRNSIRFYSFVQYLFYKQWNALHSYANENGIQIIGDVPIYVPWDSCDVWSHPYLFQMDEENNPSAVAGCPPDAFSAEGQLWGNPLYRWDMMRNDGYGWWVKRLAAAGKLYDVVRMDHFRGFEAYWSVPAKAATAKEGHWVPGPGLDFLNTVKSRLPELHLIAEDLGFLTPGVLKLRDDSGFPGMKVLGFAFDNMGENEYLPYKYKQNSVCYTGTHDNMTTRQWFETSPKEVVAYAKEYMTLTEKEGLVWGVIRTAMQSASDLCIVPMQDYLDLGAEARMNFPGTNTNANWTWRADKKYISTALTKRIYQLTKLYGRVIPKE